LTGDPFGEAIAYLLNPERPNILRPSASYYMEMLSWKGVLACAACLCVGVAVFGQTKPEEIRIRIEAMKGAMKIGKATMLYAADNDRCLPYVRSTASYFGTIVPYVRDRGVFINPRKGLKFVFNLNVAGVKLDDIADASKTPMLYDDKFYEDGSRVVDYADGHVQSWSRQTWEPTEKSLKWKFKRRPGMKPLPANHLLNLIPKSLGGSASG
jgi:hypothetical protein